MADITMCSNEKCVKKEDCYRVNAEASVWQSWAKFEPIKNTIDDFKCESYWGK